MSMGLGVALVVAVLVVYGVVSQSFHRGGEGYDLIVGAKGGKEQLVLNTVFYLSQPIGNIPYSFYEELTVGKYAADVETAIPLCMGRVYSGFRIIGTVPEMFTELRYRDNRSYTFSAGENFKEENRFDAVIGSIAAVKAALQVGDKFKVAQGVGGGYGRQKLFRVVGVLAPTGTPVDRALFVNMHGFFEVYRREDAAPREKVADPNERAKENRTNLAADEQHENEEPPRESKADGNEAEREITAVLVCVPKVRADRGRTAILARLINDGNVAQAVVPTRVIADLFESVIGKLEWILLGMAVLTVVEAGIGIMVSIYNSMSDRRHEIAVMRALGASRTTVMLIILMESILLSLMGGAFGLLLGHGAAWLFSPLIADWTGVMVGLLHFQWLELILVPGLIVLASAVGYLPAMAAYRTDVAKSLMTTP